MARVIDIFKGLREERRQERLDAMQELVRAFHHRRRHGPSDNRVGLNVFSLAGLDTDEVSHSAILAWLLDAEAGHGQGDMFLRAFLDACRPGLSLTIPDEYHVQTEFSGTLSRIDIIVYGAREFLLYIENKTVSPDTPGQHDREMSDMRRVGAILDVPKRAQFAIYLTPDGRPAVGENAHQWHRVAYRDLGQAFEALLPRITQDKVRYVVTDWLDTILTFTGTWRHLMNEFSDECALIAENWNAVLDIIRARERLDEELTELLFSVEQDLQELEWWDQGWQFGTTKSEIYVRNTNWLNPNGYGVLWMGVYDFNAAHVFGLKSSPRFYIRTQKADQDLQQSLVEKIKAAGHKVTEDKWYFIGRDIQSCPTEREAIEEYPQLVREQLIDLFTEYANLLIQFDEIIRQYVLELETKA
jgi:hypothetical protein